MQNENDSLARLAHTHGMTDLEFEERSRIEAEVVAQQVVRRWQEEEEAREREANTDFSILTDEEMSGDW